MKAIDEPRRGDKICDISLALTGDGPTEIKIFRAMAERYPNKQRLLWVPVPSSIFGRGNKTVNRYSRLRSFKGNKNLYREIQSLQLPRSG